MQFRRLQQETDERETALLPMSDSELDSEHRVWKRHMKMVLSNERTLISWIRVGATYGSGALVAATLASGQTERATATELAARYTLTVRRCSAWSSSLGPRGSSRAGAGCSRRVGTAPTRTTWVLCSSP